MSLWSGGAPKAHRHLPCCSKVFNRRDGDAPHAICLREKAHGEFIRANRALIKAVPTCQTVASRLAASSWPRKAGVGVTLDSRRYTGFCLARIRRATLIACQLFRQGPKP